MPAADVLVLEPDTQRCEALERSLQGLFFRALLSSSLEEAMERASAGDVKAVIADWGALVRSSPQQRSASSLAAQLGASIAQLRAAHASSPGGARGHPGSILRVIVTTDTDNVDAHAAAIQAGADAFLRCEDAVEESVLASYLTRYLQSYLAAPLTVAEPRPTYAGGGSPGTSAVPVSPPPVAHVTEAFALQDEDLRDPESGRWDAKRIAEALGVKLTELTEALAVNYSTVARTPDSEALQEKLAPFANVVAMARQVYAQDDTRMRKWLRQPQPALGDVTPVKALMRPGAATAVEQWVAGAWLGEPA